MKPIKPGHAHLGRILFALMVTTAAAAVPAEDNVPPALRTVAEKSEYRATARHADVVELLDRLAEHGNAGGAGRCARLSMGRSGEGRDIPMLIVGDPAPRSAAEAARQVAGGKLLVLAIGNIHAGEVDGKEALPMLARDLLSRKDHPLLKDLILAIAPIYNCDGNERVARTNRPGQVGPEDGMGIRETADGLDLNRDFIKLEARETRGLVRFFNEWDPHIFIDTHTTNGSHHRYIITWEGPKNPTGDIHVIRFVRDQMLPTVAETLERTRGVPTFVYGDFNEAHDAWETYPAHARYGTTYVGLRNRISVLSEGYSYAPYRTRVLGTRDFVYAILEFAARQKEDVRRLISDADARTVAAGRQPDRGTRVGLETRAEPAPASAVARGFVETRGPDGKISIGAEKDYPVELRTHFKSVRDVERPAAYFIGSGLIDVVKKLQQHGIRVERTTRPLNERWPILQVNSIELAPRAFQKHHLATVRVEEQRTGPRRPLPAGTFVVRTAQPLGSLAAYLLEPEGDDGLAAWNFLDEFITPGGEHPIIPLRGLLDDLPTEPCPPLGE